VSVTAMIFGGKTGSGRRGVRNQVFITLSWAQETTKEQSELIDTLQTMRQTVIVHIS
jgi:hypothetical protein